MTTASSTTITVSVSEPARADTLRKRVNVPSDDAVVHDWWSRQNDPSVSLRLLIHEEVGDHGLIDRVNRIGLRSAQPSGEGAEPTPRDDGGIDHVLDTLRQHFSDPVVAQVAALLDATGLLRAA